MEALSSSDSGVSELMFVGHFFRNYRRHSLFKYIWYACAGQQSTFQSDYEQVESRSYVMAHCNPSSLGGWTVESQSSLA